MGVNWNIWYFLIGPEAKVRFFSFWKENFAWCTCLGCFLCVIFLFICDRDNFGDLEIFTCIELNVFSVMIFFVSVTM